MNGFKNIKGTIMEEDTPIVDFEYEGGFLISVRILVPRKDLPIEYRAKVSDERATELFLSDRVVPASRQGLMEELREIGIEYYDPEKLLRYNKGRSVEDSYWIKLD